MIEKPAIAVLGAFRLGDVAVLAATFFLTIFRDLTEAIVVGFALGSVLFIHRMSKATAVETHTPFVGEDVADSTLPRGGYDEALAANPELVVYRITGAFFFGAAASIASVLDRIQDTHKALVVDFAAVPFLDSTGANVMEGLAHKAEKRGVKLFVSARQHRRGRRSLLTQRRAATGRCISPPPSTTRSPSTASLPRPDAFCRSEAGARSCSSERAVVMNCHSASQAASDISIQ